MIDIHISVRQEEETNRKRTLAPAIAINPLENTYHITINHRPQSVHVHVLQQLLRILDRTQLPRQRVDDTLGGRRLCAPNQRLQMHGAGHVARHQRPIVDGIVARSLLALETVAHGARANQSQALPQNAAAAHVLLRLQFAKVQRAGEDQHVGHVDESLQKRDGHLERHALRRLEHVEFGLEYVWTL